MKDNSWLFTLREAFEATGKDFIDLYDLIEAALVRRKTDFPMLLHNASNGYGCAAGEGFFYALDQNWDDPSDFSGVSFYIGEMETSVMAVSDFVTLMEVAINVYLTAHPEEEERVLASIERLRLRYGSFLK